MSNLMPQQPEPRSPSLQTQTAGCASVCYCFPIEKASFIPIAFQEKKEIIPSPRLP